MFRSKMPSVLRISRKMVSTLNKKVVIIFLALVIVLIIGLETQITILQSTAKKLISGKPSLIPCFHIHFLF